MIPPNEQHSYTRSVVRAHSQKQYDRDRHAQKPKKHTFSHDSLLLRLVYFQTSGAVDGSCKVRESDIGRGPARVNDRQRFGFRLIITYKFCKAALMFGVALWLTIAPAAAYRTLEL